MSREEQTRKEIDEFKKEIETLDTEWEKAALRNVIGGVEGFIMGLAELSDELDARNKKQSKFLKYRNKIWRWLIN